MNDRWYYLREGEHFGPFGWEQLRQLADVGVLVPSDLVCRPGDPSWVPMSEVEMPSVGPPVPDTGERKAGPARPDTVTNWSALFPPAAVRPRLWNSNAATNLSVLFTPAFGPILHAANWRALGHPDRAKANVRWAYAMAVCFLVALAGIWVPSAGGIGAGASCILLLAWYAFQGRSQAVYVKKKLANDYDSRSWAAPLGIATAVTVLYVSAMIWLIGIATPSSEAVAAQVKPLILAEWAKRPGGEGATIKELTLSPSGDSTYTGTVEATLGRETARFRLEVVVEGDMLQWKLIPVTATGTPGK